MNKIKIKGKLYSAMGILLLVLCLIPQQTIQASMDGEAVIRGLEKGDYVEMYRIANYVENDENYRWASAVSNWIGESTNGENYKDLQPEDLDTLLDENAKEFCEVLLMGLKNNSTGVANLSGNTFTCGEDEENTVALSPGYYVILPKGVHRVYELKWFQIAPGENVEIQYEEEDYHVPTLDTTIENMTEDRGVQLNSGKILSRVEDQVKTTVVFTGPDYPLMYSNGKRVMNLMLVVPYGFDYVENSLALYQEATKASTEQEAMNASTEQEATNASTEQEASNASTEQEAEAVYEAMPSDVCSKQQFQNAVLYCNEEKEILFFGENGYFYYIDGALLVGPEATAEDAVTAYNARFFTDYVLKDTSVKHMEEEELSEASTEEDEEKSTDSTESVNEESSEESTVENEQEGNVTKTEEINSTEDEVPSNEITSLAGNSVFILSLDTDIEFGKVKINLEAKKTAASSYDGWYPFVATLCYSASALDANRKGTITKEATTGSYGIWITTCLGYADSYLETTESILKNNVRMTEDQFILFKKSETFEGNTIPVEAESEEEKNVKNSENSESEENNIRMVYDAKENKTTVYEKFLEMNVDENGQVSIGGLVPDEYLLVQTGHAPGYELSAESLLIYETDWTDDNQMLGNCEFEVIWLDYKSIYLPATGDDGVEQSQSKGLFIMMFVMLLLSSKCYGLLQMRLDELHLITKYGIRGCN